MHLNFHKQNSNCLIGVVGQQENIFQIHSIGYESLASVLLPKMFIEDESTEEDDSSSTLTEDSALSGIDGYAAQMDYPFKDLGLTVDLFGSCNGIILKNRNTVLEARNAQLVATNAELQTKLHESQVAYQHLEQHVNAQKEVVGSKKNEVEEETAMTKRTGRKRKAQCQYNTRKASKAVAASLQESTVFEDESLTVLQRAEKEQAKLVQLSTGGSLEPYQIKDGSKSHSTSKDSYQTMTVKKLRALLKERGLMVKRNKGTIKKHDELIACLTGI
ncbi:hypothetical protein MKW98_004985 [Papaver atlanticum]|uniref:SAP domain-containing protein n=1 Tax=Papaver atlanticum TaxID=357466 RepID=A0AAD4TFK4_9MAGN|nr:hypothetical protein MKW98_004985 [Papaver atlanticum]